MTKKHLFFICYLFAFSHFSILKGDDKPLVINVIATKNGVGRDQDVNVLINSLLDLGHEVKFVEGKGDFCPDADVNVFIARTNESFRSCAKKNYLVPNAEWLFIPPEELLKYDCILCKTREAKRIFNQLNDNAVFMGFTCGDRFDPNISKNYKTALHLAGASIQKGTGFVIDAWANHPEFPFLQLTCHKEKKVYYKTKNVPITKIPLSPNINFIHEYLPENELMTIQNTCGFHICPSVTEGFGHYIVEGMSVGAVIVTTDAPPMNEFILDKRCLVRYSGTAPCYRPYRYATGYYVDQEELESVIENLLLLPQSELDKIGKKNRELFLKKEQEFKSNLAHIFNRNEVFKNNPKQGIQGYKNEQLLH